MRRPASPDRRALRGRPERGCPAQRGHRTRRTRGRSAASCLAPHCAVTDAASSPSSVRNLVSIAWAAARSWYLPTRTRYHVTPPTCLVAVDAEYPFVCRVRDNITARIMSLVAYAWTVKPLAPPVGAAAGCARVAVTGACTTITGVAVRAGIGVFVGAR